MRGVTGSLTVELSSNEHCKKREQIVECEGSTLSPAMVGINIDGKLIVLGGEARLCVIALRTYPFHSITATPCKRKTYYRLIISFH